MKNRNPQRNSASGIAFQPLLCVVFGLICIVFGATALKEVDAPILQGIDLHLGKLVSNVGVILIFIQVINSFFYKPLSEAIMKRTRELETTYSEAEDLRKEMQNMKSDYESRLLATETAAREQIQAQVREAQKLRHELMVEAGKKAEELLKKAHEDIELQKEKVLNEMRNTVVEISLNATQKLIHKNVDTEVNRNLVKEYIDTIEVLQS